MKRNPTPYHLSLKESSHDSSSLDPTLQMWKLQEKRSSVLTKVTQLVCNGTQAL